MVFEHRSERECHVAGDPIDERRPVVNPVELICHSTVEGYPHSPWGQFRDCHSQRRHDDGESTTLLHIKGAASVIVDDISIHYFNCAIRQSNYIRADGRVDLLILRARLLVVDAVVVIVGRSTHEQLYISRPQPMLVRAVGKAMPKLLAMDVNIHVAMDYDMLVDIKIATHSDWMLYYLRVDMTDGSVIGAVHCGRTVIRLRVCGYASRSGLAS